MSISASDQAALAVTAPRLRRPAVKTLLILGAGGDLTARLLLPGLSGLLAAGGARRLQLVGSDRDDWDDHRSSAALPVANGRPTREPDRARRSSKRPSFALGDGVELLSKQTTRRERGRTHQ